MGRRTILAALAGGLLACGGLPFAPPHHNVEPCRRYVAHYNALPCALVALDADDYCPAALDHARCDLGAWYECLAANARCDGQVMDLGGQAMCPARDCAGPTLEDR